MPLLRERGCGFGRIDGLDVEPEPGQPACEVAAPAADDCRTPAGDSPGAHVLQAHVLECSRRMWESYLAAGLSRMRESGELRPEADPAALAAGIMAAVQGGYVLAQASRSEKPMELALDMAMGRVRACAASTTDNLDGGTR